MKALKIIGIVVLVLVALIVILGLIAPKEYAVERTVVIDAPKDLVFNHVKYWRNWQAWSPWAEMDSTIQTTIEGQDGEAGSASKWVGDPKKTGKGEMTNTGVKEGEEISYHLHFIEPWESESEGYVRVSDEAGKTKTAWGFYGKNPFPWNIMMLFMSMDKMVGKDFDRGLALLKDLCEKEAKAVFSYKVQKTNFRATNYAAIRKQVSFNEIKGFFEKSFPVIDQARRQRGKRTVGAPAGLYYSWDEQQMTTDMAAAIPIRGAINVGDVKTIKLPSSTAYYVDYYGAYSGVGPAHIALDIYLQNSGLKFKPPVIEEYITDPSTEPDSSKWLTKIYYFVE